MRHGRRAGAESFLHRTGLPLSARRAPLSVVTFRQYGYLCMPLAVLRTSPSMRKLTFSLRVPRSALRFWRAIFFLFSSLSVPRGCPVAAVAAPRQSVPFAVACARFCGGVARKGGASRTGIPAGGSWGGEASRRRTSEAGASHRRVPRPEECGSRKKGRPPPASGAGTGGSLTVWRTAAGKGPWPSGGAVFRRGGPSIRACAGDGESSIFF